MKKYIAYDAGCNIWIVEPFNATIDWHSEEFSGSLAECKQEADRQMNPVDHRHYPDAKYESIFDY